MLKYSLTLTFALMVVLASAQQEIPLEESDVDMTILTWHYRTYEKSKDVKWKVIAVEGVGYFDAQFTYQGENYEATYDEEGFILSETKFYGPDNTPQPVLDVLDYRIVKYKVESFIHKVEFESRKPVKTEYRVQAVTKTGGQVIYWFDKDFNLLPEKRDEVASR